ncbi:MAG TPA: FHA domain-containing protein [Pseudonocardiaceae bacterium]|jgi:hypothetical protein
MSDHMIVAEAASGQVAHQVFPASGHSVLARAGDLVLLCQLAAGQGLLTGSLLDTVAAVAADHADGAVLSQRLTSLIEVSDAANVPSFCAFGPSGDGVEVVVHGRAELVLGAGADERRFAGRDGVTTVDRVAAMPSGPARAVIDGEELHFDRQQPTPPQTEPEQVEPVVEPVTAAHVRRIIDEDEQSAETGPIPVQSALVLGVYCRRSHFNDPAMTYCTVCGISMAQANRGQLLGRRPSLGVLVLDDGGMFSLVSEHVFGRDPSGDHAVLAGAAVPVALDDPSVSRVHARIVLEGWDVRVVDAGSTNGTFVCSPGEPEWTRIPQGTSAPLRPGMMLAFGRRQLRYYSHRAQSVDFTNPLLSKG